MSSRAVRQQIARSIRGSADQGPLLGRVISVDTVSRVARTRIAGSSAAPIFDIVSQELTDQLATLVNSGDQPTVKIEQNVIIAYNGRLPLYPKSTQYIAYRSMVWYAEAVTAVGRIAGRPKPGPTTMITGISGNCETAPGGTVTIDLQTASSAAPSATWTSIFQSGKQPTIPSGGYDLLFSTPFVADSTFLAVTSLTAGTYVRCMVTDLAGTGPGALTIQVDGYADVLS